MKEDKVKLILEAIEKILGTDEANRPIAFNHSELEIKEECPQWGPDHIYVLRFEYRCGYKHDKNPP